MEDIYDVDLIIKEALQMNVDISPVDRGEWKMFCCALKVLGYDESTFVALSSGKDSDSRKAWKEERNPNKYFNEYQAKGKIISLAKQSGINIKNFRLESNKPKPNKIVRPMKSFMPIKHSSVAEVKEENKIFYIPESHIEKSMAKVKDTGLYQWLCKEFHKEDVDLILKKYKVGASQYIDKLGLHASSFPYLNRQGQCVDCKIFHIDSITGSRKSASPLLEWKDSETGEVKTLQNTWALAMMKDTMNPGKKLKERRGLWPYFGEHLLTSSTNENNIGIVESEKSAIILSIVYPDTIWMATGSKSNLTIERMLPFKEKKITLYPDRDAFKDWQKLSFILAKNGFDIKIDTTIINYHGNEKDDLADIVIRSIKGVQEPPVKTIENKTTCITSSEFNEPEPPIPHSPEWIDWLVNKICYKKDNNLI